MTTLSNLRALLARGAPLPWVRRDGEDGPNYELERTAVNSLPSLLAVVEAAAEAVDCVDEEDKRDALRAALAAVEE